jgi:2-succinyl-6-hydroxy-2,4-cyclohexadiene-1-carboxylate synthase
MRPQTYVLLHGFAGAPSSWDLVAARLPVRARVLRPTLVGHAGPPTPDAPATFAAEVERLAAMIGAADARGAHIVGYSLGGRLALGLAARDPDLATRITVIGAHPGLPEGSPERVERAAADERWATLLEHEGLDAFVAAWAAQPLFASQEELPPAVKAALAAQRLGHEPRGLAHAMRALSLARMPDLRPALAAPGLPRITFMAGLRDEKFATLAAETAASLPADRARSLMVPGAGHNLLLERPAEVAIELASAKE